MEHDARWSLVGALSFLGIAVLMVVSGVGPEWYSYLSVVLAFVGAAVWTARYILDLREVNSANTRDEGVAETDAL